MRASRWRGKSLALVVAAVCAGVWSPARADRRPEPLRRSQRSPQSRPHTDPNRDFSVEQEIQGAVEDELSRDRHIVSDGIVPFVVGDEVLLLGWVSSPAERRAAARAAARAAGVGHVTNRLGVRASAPRLDLAERARRALERDDQLHSLDLSVQVASHTALVSGTVPSVKLRRRAVSVLSHVRGIRRVDDALVLQPGGSPPSAARDIP